jgi:hypothetical protein
MTSKIVVALMGLGIAACVFPTDSCACVRVAPAGGVEGYVAHSSGAPAAPAAGILIRVSAAATACPATSFTARLLSPDTTRTSDAGAYQLPVVLGFDTPTTACVRLTAHAPTGTVVVSTPVTVLLGGNARDRARIDDIRLPD